MARAPKQKMYFGPDQEQAVVNYLSTECEITKNKIFNEYLRDPLTTMVESIIRRYKLHRKGMEYQDNHNDTVSFLMTKIDKFDHTKNYKAYSYFGTICKHYLMGVMQKDQKEQNRDLSYEDISSSIEERDEFSYRIDDDEIDYSYIIEKLQVDLSDFMETENLNENETKLGYALLDIFSDFNLNDQIGEGNKFNKNVILFTIRELTSLSTKEIRVAIKKYKKLYSGLVNEFLE